MAVLIISETNTHMMVKVIMTHSSRVRPARIPAAIVRGPDRKMNPEIRLVFKGVNQAIEGVFKGNGMKVFHGYLYGSMIPL
jgi:hypothetical protein